MSDAPLASGRPRDPRVDLSVQRAAVDLFGEVGWSGFSIEAVARRAGVGKASIYLRWKSKESLLMDAVNAHIALVEDIDNGNVRDDLIQLAGQYVELFLGEHGRATLRISLEAPSIPTLSTLWAEMTMSQATAARRLVRRATSRGELPATVSPTVLLDILYGATISHAITTPPRLRSRVMADVDAFVLELVDIALAGVWELGRRPVLTPRVS